VRAWRVTALTPDSAWRLIRPMRRLPTSGAMHYPHLPAAATEAGHGAGARPTSRGQGLVVCKAEDDPSAALTPLPPSPLVERGTSGGAHDPGRRPSTRSARSGLALGFHLAPLRGSPARPVGRRVWWRVLPQGHIQLHRALGTAAAGRPSIVRPLLAGARQGTGNRSHLRSQIANLRTSADAQTERRPTGEEAEGEAMEPQRLAPRDVGNA
jgi:hypothetical protein